LPDNKNKLARIISIIFIPPFFTLIVFTVFALNLETDSEKIIITLLTATTLGVIAPIALFFILRHKGKLIDKDASLKEERTFPYIVALGFYIIGLIILIFFDIHIVTTALWFCYISITIITILINRHWKISAHTMGAAGPVAAFTYLFGPVMLLFAIIVIIVGWSRIQLKCHTFSQVVAGAFLAFVSTYIQMYLIIKIFNS